MELGGISFAKYSAQKKDKHWVAAVMLHIYCYASYTLCGNNAGNGVKTHLKNSIVKIVAIRPTSDRDTPTIDTIPRAKSASDEVSQPSVLRHTSCIARYHKIRHSGCVVLTYH